MWWPPGAARGCLCHAALDQPALRAHFGLLICPRQDSVRQIAAVERRLRFDGDLLFHFVLEDEITGNGSLMCLEAGHTADAAIILDGTRPDRAIEQHAGDWLAEP